MSLIFADGFDYYTVTAQILQVWTRLPGNATSTLIATPRRATSRYLPINTQGNGFGDPGMTVLAAQKDATFIVGAAFYRNTSPDFGAIGIYSDAATTLCVAAKINADGSVSILRGHPQSGTVLATSDPGVVPSATWVYLELKALMHASAGTLAVRLNGAAIASLPDMTGQNTRNSATAAVYDSFGFHGSTGSNIDDVYCCNGVDSGLTGQPNNTFLGDTIVDLLVPTANGETGLAPGDSNNWSRVAEVPPNDTTYNEGSTNGLFDTYVLSDPTAGLAAKVAGIIVTVRGDKTTSDSCSVSSKITIDNGANYSTGIAGGTRPGASLSQDNFQWYWTYVEGNPFAANTAWTVQNIKDLMAGPQVNIP